MVVFKITMIVTFRFHRSHFWTTLFDNWDTRIRLMLEPSEKMDFTPPKSSLLEISPSTKEDQFNHNIYFDSFLSILHNHGFHNILENIILYLPPRSVESCLKVSPGWNAMIQSYYRSNSPRFRKLLDRKLDLEWMDQDPILQSVSLSGDAPPTQVKYNNLPGLPFGLFIGQISPIWIFH